MFVLTDCYSFVAFKITSNIQTMT